MLPIELLSPLEWAVEIAQRARQRRLARNLTQEGLALRAGVSQASLKRFERTGQVALVTLLRIAMALDATAEFGDLFPTSPFRNLDQALAQPQRRRGRVT